MRGTFDFEQQVWVGNRRAEQNCLAPNSVRHSDCVSCQASLTEASATTNSRHTLFALAPSIVHNSEDMAGKRKKKIEESDLKGFKHFKLLNRILERLHDTACERDRAGNRKLHYDQYAALILLYFFNPIVTSLRGIQQASELKKVQKKLGCPRASLGSLSEAARVFDADGLRSIIEERVDELPVLKGNQKLKDIRGIITLVDGSVLSALPKLVQTMWSDAKGTHGIKLHTHFDLLKGVPTRADAHGHHRRRRQRKDRTPASPPIRSGVRYQGQRTKIVVFRGSICC